ncbi:MAG: hypothetical protein K0R76_1394 [Alphaproteobacteria bacterium]|jgi:uncharacterized protein YifN (PemK superfamily)|nr:hypothetical protein [Alphaproteobacteria bacterium]
MPIKEHPLTGSILLCDFSQGFQAPEMVKRRPVIIVSPRIKGRPGLCTIVALSATEPLPKMPYHALIDISPPLPKHFQSKGLWIKGDMVNAVAFHRLDFIRTGRGNDGKRDYYYTTIRKSQMLTVKECILNALGLANLTKHLI